jgi:hypothetical protein
MTSGELKKWGLWAINVSLSKVEWKRILDGHEFPAAEWHVVDGTIFFFLSTGRILVWDRFYETPFLTKTFWTKFHPKTAYIHK